MEFSLSAEPCWNCGEETHTLKDCPLGQLLPAKKARRQREREKAIRLVSATTGVSGSIHGLSLRGSQNTTNKEECYNCFNSFSHNAAFCDRPQRNLLGRERVRLERGFPLSKKWKAYLDRWSFLPLDNPASHMSAGGGGYEKESGPSASRKTQNGSHQGGSLNDSMGIHSKQVEADQQAKRFYGAQDKAGSSNRPYKLDNMPARNGILSVGGLQILKVRGGHREDGKWADVSNNAAKLQPCEHATDNITNRNDSDSHGGQLIDSMANLNIRTREMKVKEKTGQAVSNRPMNYQQEYSNGSNKLMVENVKLKQGSARSSVKKTGFEKKVRFSLPWATHEQRKPISRMPSPSLPPPRRPGLQSTELTAAVVDKDPELVWIDPPMKEQSKMNSKFIASTPLPSKEFAVLHARVPHHDSSSSSWNKATNTTVSSSGGGSSTHHGLERPFDGESPILVTSAGKKGKVTNPDIDFDGLLDAAYKQKAARFARRSGHCTGDGSKANGKKLEGMGSRKLDEEFGNELKPETPRASGLSGKATRQRSEN